jgi:hypothetical protein
MGGGGSQGSHRSNGNESYGEETNKIQCGTAQRDTNRKGRWHHESASKPNGVWASMETRQLKIAATEWLICKYNINVCAFMKLNFNWSKVNSLANLASWFQEKEREIRSITAHNKTELDNVFGKHQPGGTELVCRHKFLQYAKTPLIDLTGLGRWCSWPFSCSPKQVTRIVVAYRPCVRKTKGLKTVYQQHLRYIQSKVLQKDPVELFDFNLSKQIKEW